MLYSSLAGQKYVEESGLPAGDVFGFGWLAPWRLFCDDRSSDPAAASAYSGFFGRDGYGVLDFACAMVYC